MPNNNWNVSIPIDHSKIGSVPQAIKDVKSSAKIIIAKEHITPGTSQSGGQHLKGAARVYLESGLPTSDPEGNNLDIAGTSDDGRLAVDTSASNTLKVFMATSAGASTSFRAVRVERVKLEEDMDANSKNIKNIADGTQSGQAIHVGMLDTGHLQLLQPSTSGKVGLLVDTSYLSTAHASGLTVKALSLDSAVMSSVAVVTSKVHSILGSYTDEDDDNNAMLKDHAYLANQDGFVVVVHSPGAGTGGTTRGYIGATTDPSGIGDLVANNQGNEDNSIMFPVARGKYFEVTATPGTAVIWWHPIGTLVKPTDHN